MSHVPPVGTPPPSPPPGGPTGPTPTGPGRVVFTEGRHRLIGQVTR